MPSNHIKHRPVLQLDLYLMWAAPSENVYVAICGQQKLKSAWASAQSDQSLRCPLTELLDTIKSINGEQIPGCDCVCVG